MEKKERGCFGGFPVAPEPLRVYILIFVWIVKKTSHEEMSFFVWVTVR